MFDVDAAYNANKPRLSMAMIIEFDTGANDKPDTCSLREFGIKARQIVQVTVYEAPPAHPHPIITFATSYSKVVPNFKVKDLDYKCSFVTPKHIFEGVTKPETAWYTRDCIATVSSPITLQDLRDSVVRMRSDIKGFRWITGYLPSPQCFRVRNRC